MKEQQEFNIYMEWLLDGINTIYEHVKGESFESFSVDQKTIDAVCMQFLHIGETARKIEKYYGEQEKIPLYKMIGFRNFLVHTYLGISQKVVWDTIIEDLPQIKELIEENLH